MLHPIGESCCSTGMSLKRFVLFAVAPPMGWVLCGLAMNLFSCELLHLLSADLSVWTAALGKRDEDK